MSQRACNGIVHRVEGMDGPGLDDALDGSEIGVARRFVTGAGGPDMTATDSLRNIIPHLEGMEHLAPRTFPSQKRSAETVDQILDTAGKLVDEVGVEAFTTNLLAERAGIRIRTIYRYFPNKLSILTALMLRLNEECDESLQPFSVLANLEIDWREQIESWTGKLIAWVRECPGACLVMIWCYTVPELMTLQERLNEEWAVELVGALRARGVDFPERRLDIVARGVIETIDTFMLLALSKPEVSSEEIVEEANCMIKSYLSNYLE